MEKSGSIIKVKVDFDIDTPVFLKSDPDQLQRLVTGIIIFESATQYRLSCGVEETDHWSHEIAKEKNHLIYK
jgi:hypothetical protein